MRNIQQITQNISAIESVIKALGQQVETIESVYQEGATSAIGMRNPGFDKMATMLNNASSALYQLLNMELDELSYMRCFHEFINGITYMSVNVKVEKWCPLYLCNPLKMANLQYN